MNNSVAAATESKDKTTMEKKNLKEVEPVTNCDQLPVKVSQTSLDTTGIEQLILTVRGQQIIIDRDLAVLYGVETKRLNE